MYIWRVQWAALDQVQRAMLAIKGMSESRIDGSADALITSIAVRWVTLVQAHNIGDVRVGSADAPTRIWLCTSDCRGGCLAGHPGGWCSGRKSHGDIGQHWSQHHTIQVRTWSIGWWWTFVRQDKGEKGVDGHGVVEPVGSDSNYGS